MERLTQSDLQKQSVEWWVPGAAERGQRRVSFLPDEKVLEICPTTSECTSYYWPICVKMVKMVDFMLHVFLPQFLKKRELRRWRKCSWVWQAAHRTAQVHVRLHLRKRRKARFTLESAGEQCLQYRNIWVLLEPFLFFSLLGRWALKVITVSNHSEARFPSLSANWNFSLPPTICFTTMLSKCFKVRKLSGSVHLTKIKRHGMLYFFCLLSSSTQGGLVIRLIRACAIENKFYYCKSEIK